MSISSPARADGAEGGFDDGLGVADEGDDGAVGGVTRVDVEEPDAVDRLDLVGDLADQVGVASFREVGDAFDEAFHGLPGAG